MKLGDFEHLKSTHPLIGILAIYLDCAFSYGKTQNAKSAERHRDGGLKGAKTMGKRTFHTQTYQVSQGSGLLRCQNRGKRRPGTLPATISRSQMILSQSVPEQDLEI